jgi:cytochrome c oxidase assembly factor CtaG
VNLALVSLNSPTIVVYVVSLVLVMWAVVDVSRRPNSQLPARNKAAWIIGSVVGWLLLGIVGAFVAAVYLVGPRRRMNSQRR